MVLHTRDRLEDHVPEVGVTKRACSRSLGAPLQAAWDRSSTESNE